MHVLGYNLRELPEHAGFCRGVTNPATFSMDDFNMTLQLLTEGVPNIVSSVWRTSPAPGNAKGGASTWRTLETQNASAHQLVKLFPQFVSLRQKKNWQGIDGGQMFDVIVRNVVEALHDGVGLLSSRGVERPSRNGRMLEFPLPVYTHYTRPQERVLFAPARDANPFLHFFEALWMLAGREDLKFLQTFTKNFDKYADDGERMQGSYGYRWIHQFGYNQIERVIDILRKEPESRRAVITMWDPRQDLTDFYGSSDIPCNTQIYFKIRADTHPDTNGRLRLYMTICNRSNDMLWGAYGANAVHMSMLGEYVASSLGIPYLYMIQQSDSFHVYLDGPGGELWEKVKYAHARRLLWDNPYSFGDDFKMIPMIGPGETKEMFDWDLFNFFQGYDCKDLNNRAFGTLFFRSVVYPMWLAHKTRSVEMAAKIQADDWRKAAMEWLQRRSK
jgi:hypothetical protein